MKRVLAAFALAAALGAGVGGPAAAAAPPTKTTIEQPQGLTHPTACGSYGVQWNINLTNTFWTFVDDQGRLVKRVNHIREDNTVVNTVTGLTLREGPDNFVQTAFFDPETGLRELIFIVGTSAIVRRGDEVLVDRGPIWIDGQTGKILLSFGPHPLRELMDGSFDTRLALPGFCHILR